MMSLNYISDRIILQDANTLHQKMGRIYTTNDTLESF